MSENVAFVGVGSNLGDRARWIRAALRSLTETPGIDEVTASRLYETSPVGGPDQGWFLNAAVRIVGSLEPGELLETCLRIERDMGRIRNVRNGPRKIDLDLLLAGDRIVDEPRLRVPHPAMASRRFVLVPLAEIAPNVLHPVARVTVGELLARLDATGNPESVRVYED